MTPQPVDAPAVELDGPFDLTVDPCDRIHQRRFAGAVGPEDGDAGPGRYLDGHAMERHLIVVGGAEIGDLQARCGSGSCRA